jgi:hypothetical protein
VSLVEKKDKNCKERLLTEMGEGVYRKRGQRSSHKEKQEEKALTATILKNQHQSGRPG